MFANEINKHAFFEMLKHFYNFLFYFFIYCETDCPRASSTRWVGHLSAGAVNE